MKKILICPSERAAVAFLSQFAPLANLPLLGETVLGHWMEHLASRGTKEALVLATDRPEQVTDLLGEGIRWGVKVQVMRELQELTAESAFEKFRDQEIGRGLRDSSDVILLDRLPEMEGQPLFLSYGRWFAALLAWIDRMPKANRIGVREITSGVWVGLRTHMDPSVELHAPCWIGKNVRIGPNAVIGPRAVLEDRVIVESASEISDSAIGPETFVGALTKVQDSLAWGNTLINWRNGSCTQVPDPFLMCPLAASPFLHKRHSTLRWVEACRAALLKPFVLLHGPKAKLRHP
jgi:NDP-sugar pyrophosphorylase family protein